MKAKQNLKFFANGLTIGKNNKKKKGIYHSYLSGYATAILIHVGSAQQ